MVERLFMVFPTLNTIRNSTLWRTNQVNSMHNWLETYPLLNLREIYFDLIWNLLHNSVWNWMPQNFPWNLKGVENEQDGKGLKTPFAVLLTLIELSRYILKLCFYNFYNNRLISLFKALTHWKWFEYLLSARYQETFWANWNKRFD